MSIPTFEAVPANLAPLHALTELAKALAELPEATQLMFGPALEWLTQPPQIIVRGEERP